MPRGVAATDHQIRNYYEMRAQGMSRKNAAHAAGGFSYNWGERLDKIAKDPDAAYNGATYRRANKLQAEGEAEAGARDFEDLSVEARVALEDLEVFALRYFGVKLLPWQIEAAEQIVRLLETPHKEYLVVNCPPGAGKALALDTPLPTPTGWTTMKEVQIGDWLLDEAGMPCRVTNKSEVFRDHDCYRVATDDGHSVIADAGHLWSARLPDARINEPRRPGMTGPKPKTKDGWGVYTTDELARPRGKRASIPVADALVLPPLDLPIDPYVLGVWLGDGSKAAGEFACSHEDMGFVRQQFHDAGYATTDRTGRQAFGVLGLKHDLRITGVLMNKHIPSEYLRGSTNQRRALLQGLIDSDGHVAPNGMVEFTNTNERLARQTLELVHSLGVKAGIAEGVATLDGREIGPKWRVTFFMADAARLPRKNERCRNGVRTPNRYLTIEPVEPVPTQCVEVDSPNSLYLAGEGMLVTHNSKFFTNILPAWLTMRNRSLRGMIGSATIGLAKNFVDHLRQEFEREEPVAATPQEIRNEMGFDAKSTLAFDYGRIKPSSAGVRWTSTEFFVEQDAKYMAASKEATWSALGRGTAFLGYRVDFAIWDDAWDPNSMKTAEARKAFFGWWDEIAESRLEPGGLLVIVMQRLGPDDLSNHALSKKLGDLDYALDEDEDNVELEGRAEDDSPPDGRKYWHIKYKAYYQELDTGPKSRRPSSAPYPEGPLLTPRRIPWNECRGIMHNTPETWETMYQQEDVAAAAVLVKKVWVSGGTDPDTGEHHPGCWDDDRPSGLVPKGWERPLVSIATVDPSPSEWWAIQWWVYQPETNRRFLIDLVRDKMGANDFLDYNADTRMFTGIMQEWQTRSVEQDCPIAFWVVERNAAQRFMLQYNHTHNWIRHWGTSVIEHNTSGENKNSIEFGVQTIASKYRHGQVRLPGLGSDNSRLTSLKLVDEVTRYPGGRTDDQVMAHWFFEYRLSELEQIPTVEKMPRLHRPGWASSGGSMRRAHALLSGRH